MLTKTQTKHQIINHIIGCDHHATDGDVDLATECIVAARDKGERITTKFLCKTIDYMKEIQ